MFHRIDIGTKVLVVGDPTGTTSIHIQPGWQQELIVRVAGSTVALEPTGTHYSAPVVAVLEQAGCTIVQAAHSTVAAVRATRPGGAHKTDITDALALYEIAIRWGRGEQLRGVRQLQPERELLTAALRVAIANYQRATKERTRVTNRLHQLAHHIWPELSTSLNTYLRAASAGYYDPASITGLASALAIGAQVEGYEHHASKRALLSLADKLPAWRKVPRSLGRTIPQLIQQLETIEVWRNQALTTMVNLIRVPALLAVTENISSIPGASLPAIATLHAAAHCQLEYMTADGLKAVVGFYPRQHSSGTKESSSQARAGYRPARGAIHLWTMQLIGYSNNPIADYYARKKHQGARRPLAAARGKLLRVVSGVARSGPCTWRKK